MLHLTCTPHTLHFKRPAPTSRGPLVQRDLWLLRAWDDRQPEVVGFGEVGLFPGLSADDGPRFTVEAGALAETIAAHACPPPTAGSWQDALNSCLQPWDAELAALPTLRFGLESALLDLRNGGTGLCFDSPFAHGDAPLATHGLIWMDTPEGQLAQVDAKVAAGFTVIKMKVGALPFDDELELVKTLRTRYRKVTLRLDANGAFSQEEALQRIEALAAHDIEFLEQPIRAGQRDAMRRICEASPIPIVLDEELIGLSTPERMQSVLEEVRPHGVIIKPGLLGGWRMAEASAALCAQMGIAWWSNSLLESSIGHDAICQWTAAAGGVRVHGLGTGSLYRDNLPSQIRLAGNALMRDVHVDREMRSALRG